VRRAGSELLLVIVLVAATDRAVLVAAADLTSQSDLVTPVAMLFWTRCHDVLQIKKKV
jgi:hypothetical protein